VALDGGTGTRHRAPRSAKKKNPRACTEHRAQSPSEKRLITYPPSFVFIFMFICFELRLLAFGFSGFSASGFQNQNPKTPHLFCVKVKVKVTAQVDFFYLQSK
jgi:hypothetical protein